MKLSIVIVNYNVQYFLENCLNSVYKACKNIDAEIFVVDNNSVDGSIEMLRRHFPDTIIIENKVNLGFSKANNQAIDIAKGEYVLLLNPDTVIEEDTFEKCINFMDADEKIGGLGVKMVDGSGTFLPESKRGLPTPTVAFHKIFGLSKVFPKSKKYGHYHLGYIGENDTAEIEILSGAFMFLRKSVLDKIGNLDENFFMYGEDIDLSYRIIKAGYKNFYYPETRIIHYKGESTKKSSVNYVFVFYRAMVIFAKKHFSKKNAQLFSLVINMAIYLRAFIAIFQRFIKKLILPGTEFTLLVSIMFFIKDFYEKNVKFIEGGKYPEDLILISLPSIAGIWILSNFLFGAYTKPNKINKLLRGISTGTIVILIIYSLLDESIRFSRALIVLYAIATFITLPIFRILLNYAGLYRIDKRIDKKIAIVGGVQESNRVKSLLKQSAVQPEKIILIDPFKEREKYLENYTAHLYQLKDICQIYELNEVIFCSKDLDFKRIVQEMSRKYQYVDFKIAPENSSYIIGSSSNDTTGEYYIIGNNSINQPNNKRKKRALDILVSLTCIIISPLLMAFFEKPLLLVSNFWNVFTNKTSLIGIPANHRSKENGTLKLKKGILSPYTEPSSSEEKTQAINHYLTNYTIYQDLRILLKNFRKLDEPVV